MTADPLLVRRGEFPILASTPDSQLDAIDDLRASGAWSRWLEVPPVVT